MLHQASVPKEKIDLFHSLLCNSKGHYCSIPDLTKERVEVEFDVADGVEFFSACIQLNVIDCGLIELTKHKISNLIR